MSSILRLFIKISTEGKFAAALGSPMQCFEPFSYTFSIATNIFVFASDCVVSCHPPPSRHCEHSCKSITK